MSAERRRYAAIGAAIAAAAIAVWILFPRDVITVGNELAGRGDWDGAFEVWERECRRTPANVEACATAANARLRFGERDAAVALVAHARASEPEHLRVLLLHGAIAQLDGKIDEARAVWERAAGLHPGSGLPAANLGMLALEAGKLADAARWADEAITADPSLAMGLAVRGRVHASAGNLEAAVDDYVGAIERDPGSLDLRLELAEVLAQTGGWELRLEVLQEAARLAPGDPAVLTGLGETQHMLGSLEEARETLREACSLAPDAAAPRVALATVYLDLGQPGFAAPRLREALMLEPEHPDAKHLLAEALSEGGDLEGALALLDGILADATLAPEAQVRSLFLRAQIRAERGAREKALGDTEKILALEGKHPGGSWLRGRLLMEDGRLAEAEPLLRVAIEPRADGDPNPRALFDFARLRVRQGRGKEALEVLRSLDAIGMFDRKSLAVHPEFRALENDEEYRLFLEGASAPTPGEPAGLDLGPAP